MIDLYDVFQLEICTTISTNKHGSIVCLYNSLFLFIFIVVGYSWLIVASHRGQFKTLHIHS